MPRKDSSHSFRLYLLGPFRLENERGNVRLPTHKAESLLAYLVLHPEEHTREKLASLFWGDSTDKQARDSLRTALKTLRQLFGEGLLLAGRETVQIDPDYPLWVDVREFEKELTDAAQSAVSLYRGDLLADFYDEWILSERERIRDQYLEALLQLTQTHRAAGEYRRATEFAQMVLAADPANERAHQHLMFCDLALGDRAAALKQYDACVRALQRELAVEPSRETIALYDWIKQAPSERASLATQITNLPIPLSSFVGRRKEVTELKDLITSIRLLTLTGAGGSGKTRLAIQVATDMIDRFHDGVWWADLAPLIDDAAVAEVVAEIMGVRGVPNRTLMETIANYLQHKHLLLVLDNCEHLVSVCAQLAHELLTQCPNLRILATSREALGITGERVYQVPTLPLPGAQPLPSIGSLLEYEGIRLFVERASAVKSDFALTRQNAGAVVEICQRLDGIPLGLELAAARTKMLSVEHIAERLNNRFSLLTQGSRTALPRQRTLRAMIDWSFYLLTEEGRFLFRRLSVFAAGFTLRAAEAICSEEPLAPSALLDLLARLVDRSLVKVEQQGDYIRYRMLETIGEYAREKLDESGETNRLRERHRDFFVGFAEQAEPKLKSSEQFEWLDLLEVEHDNLRAAWDYAIDSDAESALRLASAFLDFWSIRGNPGEGRQWLEQLTARTTRWGQTAKRAHLLSLAGRLAYLQRDFAAARGLLEQALADARASGDQREMAFALLWLGWTALRQGGNTQTAQELSEECLKIYQGLHDPWGIAMAFYHLAGIAASQGRHGESEGFYMKSLATFRELGDKFRMGYVLNGLGELARLLEDYERAGECYGEHIEILHEQRSGVALVIPLVNQAWVTLHRGDYAKAEGLFRESLKLSEEYGNKTATLDGLAGLAAILGVTGKPELAVRLFGAVEALLEAIGMGGRRDPADQKEFDYYVAIARGRLEQAAFAKAWSEGRTMSQESAIDLVLGSTPLKS
jgi:predicted ATPase/DNA-binding SARP family transcriptional activator